VRPAGEPGTRRQRRTGSPRHAWPRWRWARPYRSRRQRTRAANHRGGRSASRSRNLRIGRSWRGWCCRTSGCRKRSGWLSRSRRHHSRLRRRNGTPRLQRRCGRRRLAGLLDAQADARGNKPPRSRCWLGRNCGLPRCLSLGRLRFGKRRSRHFGRRRGGNRLRLLGAGRRFDLRRRRRLWLFNGRRRHCRCLADHFCLGRGFNRFHDRRGAFDRTYGSHRGWRTDCLDQPRRRQGGCGGLLRLGRGALGGDTRALFHRLDRGVRENVALRQLDASLAREPFDELACDDLLERAGGALQFDAVVLLEQLQHFLAGRPQQLRDLVNPNSCQRYSLLFSAPPKGAPYGSSAAALNGQPARLSRPQGGPSRPAFFIALQSSPL
jgi:hypothetical protein